MVDLPVELWCLIAVYFDEKELRKLMGLNRVFYQLVMFHTYRHLKLVSPNPHFFVHTLNSVRFSTIAPYVHELDFWPSAVREALHATEVIPRPHHYKRIAKQKRQTFITKCQRFVKGLLPQPKRIARHPLPCDPLPSPSERHQLFLQVLSQLKYIETCSVHWYHDFGLARYSGVPLLDSLFHAVGKNMTSLSVSIPITRMRELFPVTLVAENLKEFHITLRVEHVGPGMFTSPRQQAVTDVILPFINQLAPNLHVLSITSTGGVNLALLFQGLGSFPLLKKLAIFLPLDPFQLPDPAGFHQLFKNHGGLEELNLRFTDIAMRREVVPNAAAATWLHQCYDGIELPQLKRLQLGAGLPVFTSTPAMQCITGMCQFLTSLTVVDRSLSFADVQAIVNPLENLSLQTLSLSVLFLSPELVDLLAVKCRTLTKLSLDIGVVVCSKQMEWADGDGFVEAMMFRRGREVYKNWDLADILIYQWLYGIGRRQMNGYMNAIITSTKY